jgi:hypothetical protein
LSVFFRHTPQVYRKSARFLTALVTINNDSSSATVAANTLRTRYIFTATRLMAGNAPARTDVARRQVDTIHIRRARSANQCGRVASVILRLAALLPPFRPPNGTLNQLQAASRAGGDAARPLPRLTNVFGRSDLQRT